MRANEFLIEEVNPDCLNPAFNDTQYMDGLTYRATADEEKNGLKYFQVKVFDDNFEKVGIAKFAPKKDANGNSWLESLITAVHPKYNGKGIARNIYAYVRMLGNTIKPSSDQSEQGRAMWQSWEKSGDAEHLMKEGFDQPYPIKWEDSESGYDALATLPDGSPLTIMFTPQPGVDGEEVTQVEFYRNNSQEVTGEGDAQRVFATVLTAIQQYIKKRKPVKLTFAASKSLDPTIYYEPDEPQPNPESRAKLYDRLVQRYARAWGYRAFRADNGDLVIYELSRIKKSVAENFADGKNPGRKGLAKRSGINTQASVSSLRNTAKHSSGEKQRMAHWLANMKAGRAKHKSESVSTELTELFDAESAFSLQWDNQFASSGEVHALAHDADGRVIDISFTPTGNAGVIEIYFSRDGNYDMTSQGDAPRVLATVVNAINIYLQKYQPPYIAFSAKTTGGRAGAYTAMIRRLARDYTLLRPQDYPEDDELLDFLDSLGYNDKPFILARS